jgi:hypothetical protein
MTEIRVQVRDTASKNLFDGRDPREAAVQHEFWYVGVAPVRTTTERFLHVNDKKHSS